MSYEDYAPDPDVTPDPDDRRRRSRDRPWARARRLGGGALFGSVSLLVGIAVGLTQLEHLWPTRIRSDLDRTVEAVASLAAKVDAHVSSNHHVSLASTPKADELERRLNTHEQNIQRELSLVHAELSALRVEIIRALRDEARRRRRPEDNGQ